MRSLSKTVGEQFATPCAQECEKIWQIQNLIENFPIWGYNHGEILPK